MNLDILIDARGPFDNGYIINEQLVAGEYPGDRADASRLHVRLNTLLQAGVTAFLDTTEPHERSTRYYAENGKVYRTKPKNMYSRAHTFNLPDYNHHLPENVAYARFPIMDISTPPKNVMVSILAQLNAWIDEGRVVYVHCRGGIGRTGLVIGCYLREQGYSGREALNVLKELRRTCVVSQAPDTLAQEDYIHDWPNPHPYRRKKVETTEAFPETSARAYSWYWPPAEKKRKKKRKPPQLPKLPPVEYSEDDLKALDDLLNVKEDDDETQSPAT